MLRNDNVIALFQVTFPTDPKHFLLFAWNREQIFLPKLFQKQRLRQGAFELKQDKLYRYVS